LRLEQGRLTEASDLLDRAIAISVRPNSGLPSWDAYQYRGEVRRRAGDLRAALSDYRTAVRLAREILRRDAPPDEQARMAAEGRTELGKLHGAMVDIAGLLYQRTGGGEFLREGFEVAEENRANSLLAPAPESLPDAYWAALGRLQRAEANAARSPGTNSDGAAQTARNSLAAIEASLTGAPQPPAEGVLRAMQSNLDGQTALLTFAEAEDCVWMWAVDRSAVSLYRLPPAAQIQQLDARARAAIGDNAPDAKIAGAQLYAALFGQLAPRFRAKSRWLLALDESLFSIPFAALPDGPLASAPYVVERRTIEVIPGVAHWLAAAQNPKPALTSSMVALGDPIYNAADPRLKTNPTQASTSFFQLVASEHGGLPRLVGSGAEIDICARNWGKGAVLLQGAGATREALLQEMAKGPAALHLATHVIDSSGVPPQGLIALTMGRSGAPELLEPREIESWRYRLGLVTMSGCASASPTAARSGSGLLGLTRAWLAAGARQVIASRWNVPDESGALFAALYRNLASGGAAGPALALRRAQIEMLRSRDWRSQPRYWGAYFVIGKE
jgi:CHAT domain-containing protein